jgi:hypothetical protein
MTHVLNKIRSVWTHPPAPSLHAERGWCQPAGTGGEFILLLLLLLSPLLPAQSINPDILNKPWPAQWITVPDADPHGYGVYHFRRTVDLAEKPSSFIVHVSADNRYKLYVNGVLASLGPARGDLYHWNFETVDIAQHLVAGRNALAAEVWNFGEDRPEAQISYMTAFILQGNTDRESAVNTGKEWKCTRNDAYSPLRPELIYSYYVAGPGERIDYSKYPEGWKAAGFDDSSWKAATALFRGVPKQSFDWSTAWMLVPRSIPPMELTAQRLASLRKLEGASFSPSFPAQPMRVTIPANRKVSMILDQGFLTNAYPSLTFSGGKGSVIGLSYAEAFYVDEGPGDWRAQRTKGNRNEIEGKRFVGVKDELLADGREHTFTSLWWRTYRYIRLEIETKDEALTLRNLFGWFTGYPFERKSVFTSSESDLQTMLDIGWRTARLCATETYMDCPYYEQLQYVGDTRIQAMVSLYNSGDDRLMRQAIQAMDNSRLAEGLTESRYPTRSHQEIPPFSLWWIGMLHDYWWYREDAEFVKTFLPGMRQVLHYFRTNYRDGSVHPGYWNFTDWTEAPGWDSGFAPQSEKGESAPLDFQLLWAVQLAAELEDKLGSKEQSESLTAWASDIRLSIQSKYWDPARGLYADTPDKKYYSQHSNTLAILTGLVRGADGRALGEKVMNDKSLAPATIYFRYYVHLALAKAGFGDQYLDWLGDWRKNMDMGMTTWAEMSDVNASRSDCHAWGSSPNIEFYRIVLGIDSGAPGFAEVVIKPHLGNLREVSGGIPHPKGTVSVSYKKDKKGTCTAEITLPSELSGRLLWNGQEFKLNGGLNRLDLPN